MKQHAESLRLSHGWVTMPLSGKFPIIKDWTNLKTSQFISESWNKGNNIGLVCGEISGVIVFDVDVKDNGLADWLRYIKQFGEPKTLKVLTGSGGFHYYFKYNDRVSHLKSFSRVVKENKRKLSWDLKTNGGQVVLPPSIHPETNKLYEFVDFSKEITEMPDWLLDLIERSHPSNIISKQKEIQDKISILDTINTGVTDTVPIPEVQINTQTNQNTKQHSVSVGFSGFESVVIFPDEQRLTNDSKSLPNVSSRNIFSQNISVSNDDPTKVSLECLSDILKQLNLERSCNYDDWFRVTAEIKSFTLYYPDNSLDLLNLAHLFFQRCPEKYNKDEVDKLWENCEANIITVGSLLHWLKEDLGQKPYWDFLKSHNLVKQRVTLNSELPKNHQNSKYDIYDDFYLSDFLKWVNNRVFRLNQNSREIVKSQLLRVLFRIYGGVPQNYLKISPENQFCRIDKQLLSLYRSYVYHQEILDPEDEEKTKIATTTVFSKFDADFDFMYNGHTIIPYHADETPPKRGYFNMFTGYKARIVKDFSVTKTIINADNIEEIIYPYYEQIKPILTHIFVVWANSNIEYYKYIITWLAHPLRTGKKTQKVLTLIGEPGCGKTCLLDFICRYVYGENLSFSTPGIDLFLRQFNATLKDKMFISVNEMPSMNNSGASHSRLFDKFKDIITNDHISIEQKHFEPEMQQNLTNFIISSNNDFVAHLDKGDRRYAIFECSNVYVKNDVYFENLYVSFTQETANAFYTYLRSDYIKELIVNLNEIPETNAGLYVITRSQQHLKLIETPCVIFGKEYFIHGEQFIPEEYIYYIKGRPFVSTDNMFLLYCEWFKKIFSSKNLCDKMEFSKQLKNSYKTVLESSRKFWAHKQERGYFILDSVYNTCIIALTVKDSNSQDTIKPMKLADWLKMKTQ
jgi:hypothetical protein